MPTFSSRSLKIVIAVEFDSWDLALYLRKPALSQSPAGSSKLLPQLSVSTLTDAPVLAVFEEKSC